MDPQKIQEIVTLELGRSWQGLEFDAGQINQVFDPDQDTATCPACGTEFPTSAGECTDCGLNFSG